jgi:hypothetical protein
MQAEGCQRGRARAMLPKTNFPNSKLVKLVVVAAGLTAASLLL